jgi:phosphohistidine phosphatase
MLLLLIRHAHAGQRDPERWPDDRERPLSDKGRKTMRDVSRGLRSLDLVPTLVLSSPWLRAAQTAEILKDAVKLDQPVVPCPPLAAEPDLIRLTDDVGEQPGNTIVALVGHSPWMEELGSLLLGGSHSALRIDLPKSGVLGIDIATLSPGAGELKFLLRPKQITGGK